MKVAVVGTGTAGILSISFLLAYSPEPIEVYSIHNPKKPILGIGESTSTQIPGVLCDSIGFTLLQEAPTNDSTKYGMVCYITSKFIIDSCYTGW